MGKGWGNFAVGLANGVTAGLRQQKMDEEREQDRALANEERQLRLDAQRQEREQRVALANAARPATVEEGAGGAIRPETMDDRDVGQPGEAPVTLGRGAYRAAGQTFADRAGAEGAATAYNKPEAVTLRQAGAYRAAGKPSEALTLENASISQNALRRKEADDVWRRKVGASMQGGHKGLAQLATQTEVGPLAGKKVEAIPSADGKTINYSIVNDDGSFTPTQFTFANDQNGVIQAAYLMDRAITPEHRMEGLRKEKDLELKQSAETRATKLSDAHVGYYRAAGDALTTKAGAAVIKAEGGGAAKPFKMDEDDKLMFQASNQRMRDTEKMVADALAEGGPDAAKNPAYAHAKATLTAARRDHFKLQVKLGQVTPNELAEQIMVAAKNPQEAMKSLDELSRTVGTQFADQVGTALEGNDTWRMMNRSQPKPRPKPAAAPATAAPPASAPTAPGPVSLGSARLPVATPAEAEANTADAALRAARQRLMSYGLAQRQRDPEGYATAKADVAAAEEVARRNAAAYSATLGDVRPAFATARP